MYFSLYCQEVKCKNEQASIFERDGIDCSKRGQDNDNDKKDAEPSAEGNAAA